jgi:hypothetical protein
MQQHIAGGFRKAVVVHRPKTMRRILGTASELSFSVAMFDTKDSREGFMGKLVGVSDHEGSTAMVLDLPCVGNNLCLQRSWSGNERKRD